MSARLVSASEEDFDDYREDVQSPGDTLNHAPDEADEIHKLLPNNPSEDSNKLLADKLKFKSRSIDDLPLDDKDYDSNSTLCGIGRCRPSFMQRLNQFELFVLLLSLSGVCMGMQNALKSASITKLEKRYSWDSTTVSMVTASNDMVFLPSVLIVSYFGSFCHRPNILALSCFGNAIAALLFTLPYFFFGPLLPDGPIAADTIPWQERFGYSCPSNSSANYAVPTVSDMHSRISLAMFMLSGFVEGLAAAPYWNLGVAFIDDVTGDMSGVFTGIVIASRLLSPSLGYMVYGKVIMRIPENLVNYYNEYTLKLGDPSYIPAWWLGFLFIGLAGTLISVPMFFFPREPFFNPQKYRSKDNKESCLVRLTYKFNKKSRSKRIPSSIESTKSPNNDDHFSISGFFSSLFRIFRNPIYICLLLGNIFEFMELNAVIAYFAKYLENQYHVTTGEASTLTGLALPGCNALGIVISSFIASQFTMRVPQLARYHAIVNTFGIFGSLVGFFFSCDPVMMESISGTSNTLTFPYSTDCYNGTRIPGLPPSCTECNRISFKPACIGNKNFYNLCAAGCFMSRGNISCPCYNTTMPASKIPHLSTCTSFCSQVYWFVVLYSLLKLIRVSARSQEAVLQMRCVKPRDKALGLGFNSFAFSINGVWVPIAVGYLFDNACLISNPSTTSTRTNCLFYDTTKFRYSFIGFITAAQIPACIFFYLAWLCTNRFPAIYEDTAVTTENIEVDAEEMKYIDVEQ